MSNNHNRKFETPYVNSRYKQETLLDSYVCIKIIDVLYYQVPQYSYKTYQEIKDIHQTVKTHYEKQI